ncbi:hypothetical protein ACSSS7_007001 [Eimeria intestinalis]
MIHLKIAIKQQPNQKGAAAAGDTREKETRQGRISNSNSSNTTTHSKSGTNSSNNSSSNSSTNSSNNSSSNSSTNSSSSNNNSSRSDTYVEAQSEIQLRVCDSCCPCDGASALAATAVWFWMTIDGCLCC